MVVAATSSVPSLEVAQASDPGRDPRKQVNEDAWGYRLTRHGHLLIVCDGMGGHAGGQQASQLAVATIIHAVESAPPDRPHGSVLRDAVTQAGIAVYQLGGTQPPHLRPGSTCVALLIHAAATEIAHVGDSRVHVLRGTQVWQLTRDHSVIQQMIDHGVCTPDEARRRPDANVITRALGMKPDAEVELREVPFRQEAGDVFLLATDGLCDVVMPDDMRSVVLGAPSLEAACQKLVELANARGGPDNITVMLGRAHTTATSRTTERPGATQPHETLPGVEGQANAGRPGLTIVQPPAGVSAPPTSATVLEAPAPAPARSLQPPVMSSASQAAATLIEPAPPVSAGASGTPTLVQEPPAAASFAPRIGAGSPVGVGGGHGGLPPTANVGAPAGPPVGSAESRSPGLSSWAPGADRGTQAHQQQRKALILLVIGFGLVLAILLGVALWALLAKSP